jgi:cytochrome c oxidase cbb3-type subunit 3
MSDLPNEFWGGWIAVITILSIISLVWLMISVVFGDTGPTEAEKAVWDGNLREGSTPAPVWWFWFTLAALIFSAIYLMLYPGLGSYRGALNWSMGHHLEERSHDFEQHFGKRRAAIARTSIELLQRDNEAMRAAQGIYNRNCAVCHGYDAAGQADAFPDLVDDDWQWGGTAEQVEQTIRDGRKALMVPWVETVGAEAVGQLADFVSAFGSAAPDHPGRTPYIQYCAACHGQAGEGQPALGAPRLNDAIWLYGGSRDAIHESIATGRTGEMPAFGDRLDDTQVRLLVAWLLR